MGILVRSGASFRLIYLFLNIFHVFDQLGVWLRVHADGTHDSLLGVGGLHRRALEGGDAHFFCGSQLERRLLGQGPLGSNRHVTPALWGSQSQVGLARTLLSSGRVEGIHNLIEVVHEIVERLFLCLLILRDGVKIWRLAYFEHFFGFLDRSGFLGNPV